MMKKIRRFHSGSAKEKEFLNKMLKDGYLLDKVGNFLYTFKNIREEKDYGLVVEYSTEKSSIQKRIGHKN